MRKHIRSTGPAQLAPSGVARWLLLLAVALFWTTPGRPGLEAEDSNPTEYEVKAAYLYNFGRFVEWPKVKSNNGPFTVCVLGHDPFGAALDSTLAGETLHGSKVVAKRISTAQEAANCRILFISSSEAAQLKDILTTLNKASILTVSDIPQFARHGGIVEFILDGNKVRFDVNLAAAERASLALSSQLLKVALHVRRTALPGD